MTRGSMFMFLPLDRMIGSVEFNGDMYGSTEDGLEERVNGHYKDVIKGFLSVEEESSFNEMVVSFNKEHHAYDGQMVFEEESGRYKNTDGQYRATRCSSDYTFWKNCSGRKVEMIDEEGVVVELRDGEFATFYYGKYIEMFTTKDSWSKIFKKFGIR